MMNHRNIKYLSINDQNAIHSCLIFGFWHLKSFDLVVGFLPDVIVFYAIAGVQESSTPGALESENPFTFPIRFELPSSDGATPLSECTGLASNNPEASCSQAGYFLNHAASGSDHRYCYRYRQGQIRMRKRRACVYVDMYRVHIFWQSIESLPQRPTEMKCHCDRAPALQLQHCRWHWHCHYHCLCQLQ